MSVDQTSAEIRAGATRLRETCKDPFIGDILGDLLEEIARQYDAPPCDSPAGLCNSCEVRADFVIAHALAGALHARMHRNTKPPAMKGRRS